MSFRRFVSGLAVALPLLLSTAARADVKVAWVDRERALQDIDEYKAAAARFKSVLTAKQKDLEKEQESLRKEQETLEKQMATMNDEAKRAKQQELDIKKASFIQRYQRAQQEAAESQQKELEPLINKLNQVISQIAQHEGLTMVVDKAAVAYAPPSLDITNEVVRLYNDQFKAKAPKGSDAPKAPGPKAADAPKK
ncbi:MAG TPA: OmpH family outer membrane protein [Myxococcaceae bacterium]|nr:OmpH family outer membrane protein [Myxococcaceae bacterium]